ncbi:DUF438 domain-containing protein [candidate division KSB1 bacterium]
MSEFPENNFQSKKSEEVLAPEGHPVNILMQEHSILLEAAGELNRFTENITKKDHANTDELEKLNKLVKFFRDSASHYLREENVLFPYLEKHGVTQPPAIMWREHDTIRGIEKNIYSVVGRFETTDFYEWTTDLHKEATSLSEMLSNHFYKENSILFPTGINLITDDEWKEIRRQFDELGYCSFTPEAEKQKPLPAESAPQEEEHAAENGGLFQLATGTLTKEQVESIFNTLPVEITFIDKDDFLRYFNQKKDAVFVRTTASLGREVRQCHPEKSVHLVNQILREFKNGKRNVAEFWLTLENKMIYIRYFPVFNKNSEYIGCMEVTQNITDIKNIEGEKRLL